MSEYEIIGYTAGRIPEIRKLWGEQFEDSALEERETLFRWLTEGNPFLDGRPPYYLLLHEGRVVGMHGHMPVRLSANGRIVEACLAHDDLLASVCRGKGLGKVMLRGVTDQAPSFAGSLWHNEPNRRLYQKSGWLEVPDFTPFVKIFDPAVFLETRLGAGFKARLAAPFVKAGLGIRDRLSLQSTSLPREIVTLDRFDERFDDFFDSVATRLGFAVVRNAAYLNWKFVEKPFNAYVRHVAFDPGDRVAGYSVSTTSVEEGMVTGLILDVLADPERPDVFSALVSRCLGELANEGASYVSILCSHPVLSRSLRALGFIRARSPKVFMIINWESVFEQERVGNIRNWYLTHSDADGDAWTVGARDIEPRKRS
jgi:GNAT superfamily N-acetyltransferase